MPQGSVLWPILFLVYINDLEEGVTGKILKFADDTKLFRKTKEIGDKKNLQDDIDKLVKWSDKWQMLFNVGKCKCLHTGPGNTNMHYEMGGTILSKTVKEKDLGVTMNANMKVSEQCRIAASKGNQVLGMIRRNITYGSFSNYGTFSRFLCPRGSNHVLNILPIYILFTSKQWGIILEVRSFIASL